MINEDYRLEYSLGIDFVLVFHAKLIGAVFRHAQTNTKGRLLGSVPEEAEMIEGATDQDHVWFPLNRRKLPNHVYEAIQTNEPCNHRFAKSRRYYRSWTLVHSLVKEDYDFERSSGGLLREIGKRYTAVPESDPAIIYTSYGSHPLRVATEILRSGSQANEDRRCYWDEDEKNDVTLSHTISLFNDIRSMPGTDFMLASEPGIVGLPRKQLAAWVNGNRVCNTARPTSDTDDSGQRKRKSDEHQAGNDKRSRTQSPKTGSAPLPATSSERTGNQAAAAAPKGDEAPSVDVVKCIIVADYANESISLKKDEVVILQSRYFHLATIRKLDSTATVVIPTKLLGTYMAGQNDTHGAHPQTEDSTKSPGDGHKPDSTKPRSNLSSQFQTNPATSYAMGGDSSLPDFEEKGDKKEITPPRANKMSAWLKDWIGERVPHQRTPDPVTPEKQRKLTPWLKYQYTTPPSQREYRVDVLRKVYTQKDLDAIHWEDYSRYLTDFERRDGEATKRWKGWMEIGKPPLVKEPQDPLQPPIDTRYKWSKERKWPKAKPIKPRRGEMKVQRPESEELDSRQWDSYGMELRTATKNVKIEASFSKIAEMLQRLKGKPCHYHGATTSPACSLHVHIKIPHRRNGETDILTLKHLVYLLVVYEDEIDRLMPWDRRVTNHLNFESMDDLWTNKDKFRDAELTTASVQEKLQNESAAFQNIEQLRLAGNSSSVRPKHQDLDDIRRLIFSAPDDVESLVNLIHDDRRRPPLGSGEGEEKVEPHEYHAVSFLKLLKMTTTDKSPGLVTFRQHEGTLQPGMIRWWTLFCAGLVRLANHMAYKGASPNEAGLDYWCNDWSDDISIYDLLHRMEFPAPGVEYFRRRITFFAQQSPSAPPSETAPDDSDNDDGNGPPPAVPPGRRLPGAPTNTASRNPRRLGLFMLEPMEEVPDMPWDAAGFLVNEEKSNSTKVKGEKLIEDILNEIDPTNKAPIQVPLAEVEQDFLQKTGVNPRGLSALGLEVAELARQDPRGPYRRVLIEKHGFDYWKDCFRTDLSPRAGEMVLSQIDLVQRVAKERAKTSNTSGQAEQGSFDGTCESEEQERLPDNVPRYAVEPMSERQGQAEVVRELLCRMDLDQECPYTICDMYNRASTRASQPVGVQSSDTKWRRIDRLLDSLAFIISRPRGSEKMSPSELLQALRLRPPQENQAPTLSARPVLSQTFEVFDATKQGSTAAQREQVLISILLHACRPDLANPLDEALPEETCYRFQALRHRAAIILQPLNSQYIQVVPLWIIDPFSHLVKDLCDIAADVDMSQLDYTLGSLSRLHQQTQELSDSTLASIVSGTYSFADHPITLYPSRLTTRKMETSNATVPGASSDVVGEWKYKGQLQDDWQPPMQKWKPGQVMRDVPSVVMSKASLERSVKPTVHAADGTIPFDGIKPFALQQSASNLQRQRSRNNPLSDSTRRGYVSTAATRAHTSGNLLTTTPIKVANLKRRRKDKKPPQVTDEWPYWMKRHKTQQEKDEDSFDSEFSDTVKSRAVKDVEFEMSSRNRELHMWMIDNADDETFKKFQRDERKRREKETRKLRKARMERRARHDENKRLAKIREAEKTTGPQNETEGDKTAHHSGNDDGRSVHFNDNGSRETATPPKDSPDSTSLPSTPPATNTTPPSSPITDHSSSNRHVSESDRETSKKSRQGHSSQSLPTIPESTEASLPSLVVNTDNPKALSELSLGSHALMGPQGRAVYLADEDVVPATQTRTQGLRDIIGSPEKPPKLTSMKGGLELYRPSDRPKPVTSLNKPPDDDGEHSSTGPSLRQHQTGQTQDEQTKPTVENPSWMVLRGHSSKHLLFQKQGQSQQQLAEEQLQFELQQEAEDPDQMDFDSDIGYLFEDSDN